MDVTLGVSVAGADARIALLDAASPHTVIDQSEVDLTDAPLGSLVSTLVATDRALTDSGHRLVATRVCSSSTEQAAQLKSALVDAGIDDVSVVSQPEAFSAVARSLTPGETVASLTADADTAALSIVDADSETTSLIAVEPIRNGDRPSAYRLLLERFNEEPGGATSVIVMGGAAEVATLAETTPIPLTIPDAADFAVARGAALAGFGRDVVPDLYAAETVLGRQSPQLAYSEVDDESEAEDDVFAAAGVPMQTPMRPLSEIDPDEVDADADGATARPRVLLLGSTVAAVVVVGFAALAVSVAISIRPTVSEQAIRMQKETVPGKYFPVTPGQGVNKDGDNWTMVEQVAPPGTDTGVRTFQAKPLNLSSGTANVSAPRVIEVFRDGTVGVQGLPNPAPIDPGVINAAGVPGIPEFVPRLIPDFSKVNMSQVLNFLGNMQPQRVVDDPVRTTGRVVNPVDGTSLEDIGALASVRSTQGELFSADKPVTGTPGGGAIPREIFQTDTAAVGAAQRVLPPDTTLISGLQPSPESEKSGSIPIFGEVLPDFKKAAPNPEGALPGVDGTAPPQGFPLPGLDATAPKQAGPLPDLGETLPTPPILDPKTPGTAPERPNIFPVPIENPFTPKPEIKPDVPIVKPDVPIVKPDVPIVVPNPDPPVFTPPKPIFTLPKPVVTPPAPVVDSPPEVSIPTPVIELPKIFPVPAAPSVPDPVVEAPAAPVIPQLPSIPLLPNLPFGGGLFGSGQN